MHYVRIGTGVSILSRVEIQKNKWWSKWRIIQFLSKCILICSIKKFKQNQNSDRKGTFYSLNVVILLFFLFLLHIYLIFYFPGWMWIYTVFSCTNFNFLFPTAVVHLMFIVSIGNQNSSYLKASCALTSIWFTIEYVVLYSYSLFRAWCWASKI